MYHIYLYTILEKSSAFLAGLVFLATNTDRDVHFLDFVEAGEYTSTSNTSQDVSSSTLHQSHEALVSYHGLSTVQGSLVLDSLTTGHHHPPSDGIDRVGHKSGCDRDTVSQQERQQQTGIITQEHWFEGVVETEVEASVDKDSDTRDHETSVETSNTVRFEGLLVDVNETVVLARGNTVLSCYFGVVSETSSSVVERVDETQRHGSSNSTRQDVRAKLNRVASILGDSEGLFDLSFEGKVKGLGGEVPQAVSQVTSPERVQTFAREGSCCTIYDSLVWPVQPPLLNHLILVLDEKLYSLNRSGSCL